jgi:hypothetical protein
MQRREGDEVATCLAELVKILYVVAHRIGYGCAFALAFPSG